MMSRYSFKVTGKDMERSISEAQLKLSGLATKLHFVMLNKCQVNLFID